MAASLQFLDMSVSVSPPNGHFEPVPLTLGPSWQPNDIRMVFISGSAQGAGGITTLDIPMTPDPPTGFTTGFSRSPGWETHGIYFRRLAAGDNDTGVTFPKPTGWQHYMLSMLTIRGVSPTSTPTAGLLSLDYQVGDVTGVSAAAASVAVPAAGTMVFFVGDIAEPSQIQWPNWPVSINAPSGWTNLVATDKSGQTFYQYGTDAALIVVGKSFGASGSTGTVTFPTAQGNPAFTGMWTFLTPAADVSAAIGAV